MAVSSVWLPASVRSGYSRVLAKGRSFDLKNEPADVNHPQVGRYRAVKKTKSHSLAVLFHKIKC
jgi:hypothetical protein